MTHSRPYRPQGRGKIERFFNTVTSQFLTEISTDTTTNPAPGKTATPTTASAAAGSAISSLEELNALFTSWVEMVYHRAVHSTTGQTPLARWDAGWASRKPNRKDAEQIAEAFRWSALRTVTKSATVSLQSNTYQVDPFLAGKRVELVYDPFDLAGPITVSASDGVPAGEAVLVEIKRHVHKKAANAVKDTDTGAVNASSGIDYLRLVEARHKETMAAAPISFHTMSTPNTDADRAQATQTSATKAVSR